MVEAKKKVNRNLFEEKILHRYYLESLYFFENTINKNLLIPNFKESNKIKYKNLALVVPEFTYKKEGYRADFALYFKNLESEIPVEIKWRSSLLKNENQINVLKRKKGFLVVLDDDVDTGIPTVELNIDDFQEWVSKRILNLTSDSISHKIHNESFRNKNNSRWIVALRSPDSFRNFNKMYENYNKNPFWAFLHNKHVTSRIFSLQKNDSMLFLFYKSPEDGNKMKKNRTSRPIEIHSWAEVNIEIPYYMSLDGEQAEFFEKIRLSNNNYINISNRKWVHFIDFKIKHFKKDLELKTNSGILDEHLVDSSNKGGVLKSVPNNDYNQFLSLLKSNTVDI